MSISPVQHTYEALVIFRPVLDIEQSDALVRNLENQIKNLKGKILKMDKLGRKRLAYEMGKFKDGVMALMVIDLDPTSIVEFRKYCQLSEDVLRLTLVRLHFKDKAAMLANHRQGNLGERDGGPDHRPERGGDRRDFRGGGGDRNPRFNRDRDNGPPRHAPHHQQGGPGPHPQQQFQQQHQPGMGQQPQQQQPVAPQPQLQPQPLAAENTL